MPVTAKQVPTGSAIQLYDPTDARGDKVEVTIQNNGPNAIWLNSTEATATSVLGLKLAAGATYTPSSGENEVWATADTATQVSPADTRVSIEGKYD